MERYPVIGLEIHVQLNTRTKLFCGCINEYNPDNPNINICPFCTGQPGALPRLNKEAVKKAITFGLAVGGTIPEKTRWDRKNYFYADLPAGYQISQYDNPIVEGGIVEFFTENKETGEFTPSSVELTRAHLEADAGKLLHAGGKTLVDYNRSGAPLIEIVTEPVIRSSEEAMAFVNELQLIVRRIGVSDGNMEKGQIRFDCNVSLQTQDQKEQGILPGYRTETKNINSVRALGRAIEYEIKRQNKLLDEGQTPIQETRGWKDDQNKSVSQRSKEDAMDYRYFPEPDIPLLTIKTSDCEELNNLPELPSVQRQRYLDQKLSIQSANTLVSQSELADYYDATLEVNTQSKATPTTLANILTVYIKPLLDKHEKAPTELLDPNDFVVLSSHFENKKINNQGLQKSLDLIASGTEYESVDDLLESHNLVQIDDDSLLEEIVDQVIVDNPGPVSEYKGGKQQTIGFLIGQCMKASKGAGNPQKFRELLIKKLED